MAVGDKSSQAFAAFKHNMPRHFKMHLELWAVDSVDDITIFSVPLLFGNILMVILVFLGNILLSVETLCSLNDFPNILVFFS